VEIESKRDVLHSEVRNLAVARAEQRRRDEVVEEAATAKARQKAMAKAENDRQRENARAVQADAAMAAGAKAIAETKRLHDVRVDGEKQAGLRSWNDSDSLNFSAALYHHLLEAGVIDVVAIGRQAAIHPAPLISEERKQ
jgi:hypothetical protein